MLEDVERIEVISGPGATLWGANAVNGVINVITRSSGGTQGDLATAGGGDRELRAAVRHGGALGSDGHFRIYGKVDRLQNTTRANGSAVADGWDRTQAGFRADWGAANGAFTLQGDAYSAQSEQRGLMLGTDVRRVEVSGMNLLARWTRKLADGSDVRVQAYYDQTDRDDFAAFRAKAEIFDLEIQHAMPLGAHKLLWGGGYRRARDDVQDGLLVGFVPPSKVLQWGNLFVQDEIALSESLSATLGVKFEHNDYTGTESLPSARLAWKLSARDLVWAAASRAVRAPARLDREIFIFPPSSPNRLVNGGPNFVSEMANVAELGYRAQPTRGLTYSVTAFYYDWDKLRSTQPPPAVIENMIEGAVYGLEAWAAWQAAPSWRLSGGLTTLHKDLRLKPGSTDPSGPRALGNDPDYQWMLRSSHNLAEGHELDIMLRRVAELPFPNLPDYLALDMRYGWRMRRDLELSLTVQNLGDPGHPESGTTASRSEIARSVFLKLRWSP
jgi:iron complex outermembrane receptor protein